MERSCESEGIAFTQLKWFFIRSKKKALSAVDPKEQQVVPLTKTDAPKTAGADGAPKGRLRPQQANKVQEMDRSHLDDWSLFQASLPSTRN